MTRWTSRNGVLLRKRARGGARWSALVLALTVLAAGCSDDGDPGPTEPDPEEPGPEVPDTVSASVAGAVTEHGTGAPVAGAAVEGTDADGGDQLFEASTDSEGTYGAEFEVEEEPGQVTVEVSSDVHPPREETVSFAEEMTLDLVLEWPSFEDQDCTSVDPDEVEIQEYGDRYRIVEGSSALLVADELDEAVAMRDLIQHYGLSRYCFATRPDPIMIYWLVDGSPPRAFEDPPVGEDCISINPDDVELVKDGDTYRVVDGSSGLMATSDLDEAIRARDLIHFYGFTQYCFVGRPDPGMRYWLR